MTAGTVGAMADDTEHDVVVYELEDWEPELRGRLDLLLTTRGIEHRWERPEGLYEGDAFTTAGDPEAWAVSPHLVVAERDEEAVDGCLDEVEFPMALEPADDNEDDEAVYEVMAGLFNAADRLMHDPGDHGVAGEFMEAADAAKAAAVPFGVDGEAWAEVVRQAGALAGHLEADADDATVVTSARDLRQLLQPYV